MARSTTRKTAKTDLDNLSREQHGRRHSVGRHDGDEATSVADLAEPVSTPTEDRDDRPDSLAHLLPCIVGSEDSVALYTSWTERLIAQLTYTFGADDADRIVVELAAHAHVEATVLATTMRKLAHHPRRPKR